MRKLLCSRLEKRNEYMNAYLDDAKEEIGAANLRIFCWLSVIVEITIVIFTLMTGLLLPSWRPGVFHLLFLLLNAVFCILSFTLLRFETKMSRYSRLTERLFLITVMLFVGILDTIPSPDHSQIFIGIALTSAPVIYIVSFRKMLLLQSLYTGYFMGMLFCFKNAGIARTDALAVLLGAIAGIVLYQIAMSIRANDYVQKKNYKLLSEQDGLTGISNRSSGENQIHRILETREQNELCAMMILDIDDFKQINDSQGHSRGDEVLIAIAGILKKAFRKEDVVSRFGGDEFLIFIAGFRDEKLLPGKCDEINEQIRQLTVKGISVSGSIGVCLLRSGEASMDEMFQVADRALYEAKSFHKGKYRIHDF